MDYYDQLIADIEELTGWIQRRDGILDRVLYYSRGACQDLRFNIQLVNLGAKGRLIGKAANQLALGIGWIREGKEEQDDVPNGTDLDEPLAQAAEYLAGNAIDWTEPGISKRQEKRRYRANWRRKELPVRFRIETAISASHHLTGEGSIATDPNISDCLQHLANAERALHAPDPEEAVYELGRASQCLWEATNFRQVRERASQRDADPGYSSAWKEGEAEHWETRIAVNPAYESLKSHGERPKLPRGVRVVDGGLEFSGWRWTLAFLTWPVLALVVGLCLGYWIARY